MKLAEEYLTRRKYEATSVCVLPKFMPICHKEKRKIVQKGESATRKTKQETGSALNPPEVPGEKV